MREVLLATSATGAQAARHFDALPLGTPKLTARLYAADDDDGAEPAKNTNTAPAPLLSATCDCDLALKVSLERESSASLFSFEKCSR